LNTQHPAFLDDHRIYGTSLFPGTGYAEMALAAAGQLFGSGSHSLEEIVIQEALVLPEEGERTVQIGISPLQDGVASFQVFSLEEDAGESWKIHASGKIRIGQKDVTVPEGMSVAEVRSRCSEAVPADGYYQQLADLGVAYGPSFRGITQIWRRPEGGEALGRVSLPENFETEAAAYQLHPALLAACFQLLGLAMMPGQDQAANGADKVYVPVGLARYQVYRPGYSQAWSQAALHLANGKSSDETATGDLRLFDEEGQLVAEVVGLRLKRVSRSLIRQIARKQLDEWLYEVKWQRQEQTSEAGPDRSEPGSWLIFADNGGVADSLVAQLQTQGERCTVVWPGERYQASEGGSWQIDPASPEDFRRLLTERDITQPYRGIVHLWSLNVPQETTGVTLSAAQAMTWGSVLNLVQALTTTGQTLTQSVQLWLVTKGTQPVGSVGTPLALAQAPLWGLGRTIALEHPELGCICLDLDPAPGIEQGTALFREIWSPNTENQVALRRGSRYVARLVSSPPSSAENKAVEVVVSTPGILDSLTVQPAKWQQPNAGEVEIRVQATGLNFRDVLNAKLKQQLGESQGQPLIQELLQGTKAALVPAEGVAAPQLWQQLAGLPPVEQRQRLLEHVQDQISRVLGLESSQALDLNQGLTDLGMDSLMAVEISRRLQTSVGASLSPTLAFEYSNIEALTHYLATTVLALESPQQAAKEGARADEMTNLIAELEGLSEDELEDAILKELKDAGY
jgi:myxalamid-type polyketide synthase MxaB